MRRAFPLLGGSLLIACGVGRSEPDSHLRPAAAATAPGEARTREHSPEAGESLPSWSGPGPQDAKLDGGPFIAAELARDGARPELLEALAGDDLPMTRLAARALARIGDDHAAYRILDAIAASDGEPSPGTFASLGLFEPVRTAADSDTGIAALADRIEAEAWTRYALTEDADLARAALFVVARVGGDRSQQLLAGEAVAEADAGAREAVFEAIGILCARRVGLTQAGAEALTRALDEPPAATRQAALYALGRCATQSAERFAARARAQWIDRLESLVHGESPEDARLAWKIFTALGEAPSEIPARLLSDAGAPWLVEVEAARALAAHPRMRPALADRLGQVDLDVWRGARWHGLLTGLAGLRRAVAAEPELNSALDPLRRQAERKWAANVGDRLGLALLRCELRALQALVDGAVAAVEGCADESPALPPQYGRNLAADILAMMGSAMVGEQRVQALLAHAQDPDPIVAAHGLSLLADLDDARVNGILRGALGQRDVGVLAAAAGAVAARAVDRGRRDPLAVEPLEALLTSVDNDHGVEARIAAVEALAALAQTDGVVLRVTAGPGRTSGGSTWLERSVAPLLVDSNRAVRRAAAAALRDRPELLAAGPPDSGRPGFAAAVVEAVEAFGQRPAVGLRVHGRTGAIEIDFAGADAPIAQANLVALARAGRLDGLRWHRVVPGFVVQGGDPRGDGYGGPGWVIPCEWSDARYQRGTVGMASAGPDTGGSQLFVAHTRQPHLDGRYTVVGHVRAGIGAVDELLPHDVMAKVEAVEAWDSSP